jgi:tetratricopeptide (TPR) repeat protein
MTLAICVPPPPRGGLTFPAEMNTTEQSDTVEGNKMKRSACVLGMIVLLGGAATFASAQTADERLKKGDEYYAQLNDAKALEEYLAAAQAEPNNFEAAWKACRSLIDNGDLLDVKIKGNGEKQKKFYKDSQIYARKAVALNAESTWSQFYLSAALGKYALLLGKKEQISMSKEVKTAIDKAIALDPNNDLAYHALGRWQRRMAEIGGATRLFGGLLYGSIPKGSFEEAEKSLKKAAELKPDYINHHLELGRTYMALKKYDLAAQEFEKCEGLPIALTKDNVYKEEAKQELAAAKKKLK